jgi:uncharacterized membrane protein
MNSNPKPRSVTELMGLRRPLKNVNKVHADSLGGMERLAIWITDNVGSMGFFMLIFVWTMVWLGWNSLGPKPTRFDPFPAFVLWLFISNMIQIFLMPLIMIGQNLQGRHTEMRAEADYEVNTRAEREIETILQHLENQSDLILKILQRLEEK